MNATRQVNYRVFRPLAAVGTAVMGYGIYGLLVESDLTHPTQWIRWFLGAAIAHDLVLAPAVAVVGIVVARRAPTRYRAHIQGALVASGIILLTAYPYLRGYGRRESNPTILPNNYLIGSTIVILAIWAVAGLLAWRAHRRQR